MDICIEEMISCCLICQSVRNNPSAAPLHQWPWTTRIWQRVHIDFAEKGEQNYLIVVDSNIGITIITGIYYIDLSVVISFVWGLNFGNVCNLY